MFKELLLLLGAAITVPFRAIRWVVVDGTQYVKKFYAQGEELRAEAREKGRASAENSSGLVLFRGLKNAFQWFLISYSGTFILWYVFGFIRNIFVK